MSVKSAARVLDVIEAFAAERRPLTMSELARILAIPGASCLELIRTLAGRGYLYEVERRGGFYPTGRLQAQAAVIGAHDPIVARASDALHALRDRTGETVVLARLRGHEVLYLDVVESRQSVRYIAEIGATRPVQANSLGKALLAALDPAARDVLLAEVEFRPFTARTLDRAALERDLEASEERGCYCNLGESVPDLGAIARPLRLGDRYAVSVAGPLARIEAALDAHAEALREACAAIEGRDS
ncbi:IclR family transcriptional regulator [Enterovirga rhinocerotis]|uniref:IclR family transcriptional regulator n=1 Tax=Enterovirga rhinocerotis TaxID=1339210 RepID=A0A4R7CDS8_9HYPH|nr:IclR family transcriptional regulator C-terminal domain-containing protein [Enterovirga rhinocerotis]TDR94997.1 IclR family transcriptional regulator [Enterovirga rhinocerotis]